LHVVARRPIVTAETRGRKRESATGAVRNVEGSMIVLGRRKARQDDRGGVYASPDLVLVVRQAQGSAVPVHTRPNWNFKF
jgi:hypothetical protein